MKKSLVLAMAMALGVTASAYAANPFSDVPAGHWAYDSISKLAAAGVVEGYPDGSFKGDNLMTRYEMAQIVAKAMAKGANVDALAAEFADELDNLGVRVAALEKKADNVKITGQFRYVYANSKVNARPITSADKGKNEIKANAIRTRLWVAGQINEDWTYTGMLENTHNIENYATEEGTVKFRRAYVDGKLGGLKVRAGRMSTSGFDAGAAIVDSTLMSPHHDGILVKYGKDIQITGLVAKIDNNAVMFNDYNTTPNFALNENSHMQALNIAGNIAKGVKLNAGVYHVSNYNVAQDEANTIWNIGAQLKPAKDLLVTADWFKGKEAINIPAVEQGKNGWAFGAQYKGASAAKPGSYGIFAKYFNMGGNSYIANPLDIDLPFDRSYKGYMVGAQYAFAKNIVGQVHYADLKSKNISEDKAKTLWSQLVFTF